MGGGGALAKAHRDCYQITVSAYFSRELQVLTTKLLAANPRLGGGGGGGWGEPCHYV